MQQLTSSDAARRSKPAGFPGLNLNVPPLAGFTDDSVEAGKKQPFTAPVPALDFRSMKAVKETDWYTQCKKLEEVIKLLREKIEKLETGLEDAHIQTNTLKSETEDLKTQLIKHKECYAKLENENKNLQDQVDHLENRLAQASDAEELKMQKKIADILNYDNDEVDEANNAENGKA